jgi:hypothetical protein
MKVKINKKIIQIAFFCQDEEIERRPTFLLKVHKTKEKTKKKVG